MGLKKKFATNTRMENEGVWNQFDETFRVKIARTSSNNMAYVALLEKMTKPFRRTMDMLDKGTQQRIMREVFARTVVTGWQTKVGEVWKDGIELEDGELMAFTPENVMQTFEELPDLFMTIQQFADDAATYRQVALEAEAKNLQTS